MAQPPVPPSITFFPSFSSIELVTLHSQFTFKQDHVAVQVSSSFLFYHLLFNSPFSLLISFLFPPSSSSSLSTSDSLSHSFLPFLHLLLFQLFLLLLISSSSSSSSSTSSSSSISTSLTQRLTTQHLSSVPTFSPNNPAQPTPNHKQRCSYCKSKLKKPVLPKPSTQFN